MCQHGGVHERLVVNELVQLRGLSLAVEDQRLPKRGRFNHLRHTEAATVQCSASDIHIHTIVAAVQQAHSQHRGGAHVSSSRAADVRPLNTVLRVPE